MKVRRAGLSFFATVALVLASACSSSSSPGNLACTFTLAPQDIPECFAVPNSTATEIASVKSLCEQQQNVVFVTSCPTAGLLGCCTDTSGLAHCNYAVDGGQSASSEQETCVQDNGKWSTTM